MSCAANKKTLWLVMLMAFLAAYAHGQQFNSEADFRWSLSSDGSGVIIAGYAGTAADLRIPPHIQGVPVTEIAPWAFLGGSLTSVAIPDTVVSIGAMAFASNQISNLTLGAGIAYIGLMAFAGNQLADINLPSGVAFVGAGAFRDNHLTRVTIPVSLASFGEYAFGDAEVLTAAGDVFDPWTVVIVAPGDRPPLDHRRLWSVGIAGGISAIELSADSGVFSVGGTIQATAAPWRNTFIRIGCDIFRGTHSDYDDFSSWQIYPFAHAAFFLPVFGQRGGLYAGVGAGFMFVSYSDIVGDDTDRFFAMDVLALGAVFTFSEQGAWGLSASYVLRTDFSGFSDRFSLGVIYRFDHRGMPWRR